MANDDDPWWSPEAALARQGVDSGAIFFASMEPLRD